VLAAPAQAAAPPPGYPTSQVMANASNPTFGTIPIRRGFYDADANKGWGMDKAWNKHNLRSLNGQKILMGSPNATPQGNGNVDLKTYVGYYKCSGKSCTLQKQVLVHGIYAPNDATYIQGWPVGGKVGLFTAYCDNDNRALDCPNWVTYSLDHPGQNNPYTNRIAPTEPEPGPTAAPSAPNTRESDAVAGADLYSYSYSELPTTVASK
jgi:hypothetical protein